MKANELRIGNLVSKGHEWYVTDFITIKMAHNYEPIPLTPEILEKIEDENNKTRIGALTRNGQSVQWEFNYQKIYLDEHGIFHYITEADDFGNYIDGIKLTSLHQLQNLYFSLTGVELKVNFHVEAAN